MIGCCFSVVVVVGVDLDSLAEVGDFISKHLRRPSHSRVASALIGKKRDAAFRIASTATEQPPPPPSPPQRCS